MLQEHATVFTMSQHGSHVSTWLTDLNLFSANRFLIRKLVSSPDLVKMLHITARCKQLILSCHPLLMQACKRKALRNESMFLIKGRPGYKVISHRACSQVVSVPSVRILQQQRPTVLTEDKTMQTWWQGQKNGLFQPKAENEKALWSLGLVHMYSALHAEGPRLSVCP